MRGLFSRRRNAAALSASRSSINSRLHILPLEDRCVPSIAYSTAGTTYTQDFTALPSSGTITPSGKGPFDLAGTPVNATGLGTGNWFFEQNAGSATSATFLVGTGSAVSGGAYSFGSAALPADRALGLLASNGNTSRVGAVLVNNTGTDLTEFTVTYDGEQWRRGAGVANALSFQYSLGGTGISTALFTSPTAVTGLNFTSPVTTGTSVALDGNAAANRTANITATVSGVVWPANGTLVLRWNDTQEASSNDGIAIDNVRFSAKVSTGGPGTFSIAANTPSFTENGGTTKFTITRGTGTTGPVDVNYTLTGTASAADYTASPALSGTVSFVEGDLSKSFDVTALDDGLIEGNETLIVTLTSATNGGTIGTPAASTVTIVDDDPPQTQYFALSGGDLNQSWTNKSLISTGNVWSGVPGFQGFAGIGGASGVNPQTFLGSSNTLTVNANQTDPLGFSTGGPTEFELTDPTIALAGTNTILAPNLVAYLDTTGKSGIQVSYRLRDLETTPTGDDALEPIALQYRVGNFGPYINVPTAYIADATVLGAGPDTPVVVTLPSAVDNQPRIEVRWVGVNAAGNDEWVGIDDISIISGAVGPGKFAFANAGYSLAENGGTATVVVNRTFGSTGAVDVTYTIGGTAAATDYSAAPALTGTFSFAEGETSQTIVITGIDDGLFEGTELLNLTLTAATNGGVIGTQAGTAVSIVDDDPPQSQYYSLAGGNYTQAWTDTTLISTTTGWSGIPNIRGFQTVTGATGSAQNPENVVGPSQTLSLYADQTNPNTFLTGGVVEFELPNDPTVALIGTGTAVAPNLVMYLDTTGKSNITVAYNVRDLEDGVDDAIQHVALQYRVGSIGDYIDIPEAYIPDATLAGATTSTAISISLPVAAENQPKVELRWLTFNAIANDEAVGIDDISISTPVVGTPGTLGFNPTTATAGEAAGTVTLTVQRTGGTLGAVSANYAVTGGTATGGGVDFTLAAGTVSWASGDLADKTITINVVDDTLNESNETILVALSSPTGGATLGSGANLATVTITDNDPAGSIGFSPTAIAAGESAGTATLTVKRTGGSAGAVSASYAVTGGTATGGADFTLAAGTVSWAAGDTADKTINIALADDALTEANETIQVSLSSPTGGAALAPGATVATATITDNDPVAVAGVSINGGDVQRSTLKQIAVTFNGIVTIPADTFTLFNPGFNGGPSATLTSDPVELGVDPSFGKISFTTAVNGSGQTVATLTFAVNPAEPTAVGQGVEYGSLADGAWVLTVHATSPFGGGVANAGGVLLAADYVTDNTPSSLYADTGRIYRLFGNADGDTDVDLTDLSNFRTTLTSVSGDPATPAYNPQFDLDADGDVDLTDLSNFRARFTLTV